MRLFSSDTDPAFELPELVGSCSTECLDIFGLRVNGFPEPVGGRRCDGKLW